MAGVFNRPSRGLEASSGGVYPPRVWIGDLPFPTKKPPRLREAAINRITKATFFMNPQVCMNINPPPKIMVTNRKFKSGHDARSGHTHLKRSCRCCPANGGNYL